MVVAYKVYYNQGENIGIILSNFDEKILRNDKLKKERLNKLCLMKYNSEIYKYEMIHKNSVMLRDLSLGELKIYLKYCIN